MDLIPANECIVDLFAGGGGASEGILIATGRHPDIAINHDPEAVAAHEWNHRSTRHFCESIWKVKPTEATAGRPVGLLWASPDCRHFSRAAGGRPKWKQVRSLPGVVLTWAKHTRPRVIIVENVSEMVTWGPLLDNGLPDPARVGLSFNIWVGRLRGLGYRVEFKDLCAADYGARTSRSRFVLVATRDGAPIVWPTPTHSKTPTLFEQGWSSVASCIDWSQTGQSIFERPRPLAEATLRRVAQGVTRYILQCREPFVVNLPSQASADHSRRVSAFMAQHNGGMVGHPITAPLSTLTTRGTNQALVTASLGDPSSAGARRVHAFLVKYYGAGSGQHQSVLEPLHTLTTKARFALVTADVGDLAITDISMRMLFPREMAAAQGFPSDYDLSVNGTLGKTTQVRLIGNSVCPPLAAAVVKSVFMGLRGSDGRSAPVAVAA